MTEIQGLENLFDTTAKNAPDRPFSSRAVSQKRTSSFRVRRVPRQDQAEIDRDAAEEDEPAAPARSRPREPGRPGHARGAEEGIDNYTLIKTEYPSTARSTRSSTTSRTSTSRRTTSRTRARSTTSSSRSAGLEVHPERVPRVRRALLQRSPGRPVEVGPRRPGVPRGHRSTRRREQGLGGYAWYKLAYVFWNKGELEKALNAFKKTIDFWRRQRSSRARQARRRRAPRRHPGLRAQGRPAQRTTSSTTSRATRAAATPRRQDDGQSGCQLPGHRPLPGGHHPLSGSHGPRHRGGRRASTRRTSPKRRWR